MGGSCSNDPSLFRFGKSTTFPSPLKTNPNKMQGAWKWSIGFGDWGKVLNRLFSLQVSNILDPRCIELACLKDNHGTSSCHSRLTCKAVFKLCSLESQCSLEDLPWDSPWGKVMVNMKELSAVSPSHTSSLPSPPLPFNQNNSAFIAFMYWPSPFGLV